jgi:penicillin amidase
LEAPVEVLWDSVGIPHVFAATARDALFAQGYLHATHRLWQMEMFRRVAQGRLSELFGESTLETDRFLRTVGMDRAAEAGAALLDTATKTLLEGYVEGVNAAIQGWGGPLPPEFLLLRAAPEPYTLSDVLALEKIMAWDLADYQRSLDLAEAQARLGDSLFQRVRPRYPGDGISILESAGLEDRPARQEGLAPGRAQGPGEARPPGPAPDRRRIALLDAALRPGAQGFDFVGAATAVRASNAWVVGPERSASGRPLVANDMHLALDQPTIWYLVGLHAPGLDVVGMSLPGTAGVVAGRTSAVAWGFTNAMLDDTELFLERVDPDDPGRYLVPGGSEPFEVRREVIRVRGGGQDTLTVRTTRHGPVITPVEPRAGDELMALRWVALDPSTTPGAILGMNRATSVESFLSALEGFTDPHQNVVFADTSGAWGYWMAGRIPDRPSTSPPQVPVPGWTGEHDWRGYLPFSAHPHALAPPSGFVATANNRQSWGEAGTRVSSGGWAPPHRAQRITDLLEARVDHDVASMHAIQLDVTSLPGLRFRSAAASAFRSAGLEDEARTLQEWDGRGAEDSRGAALFQAWYDAVREGLRREIHGDRPGYLPYAEVDASIAGGLSLELQAAAVREARQVVGRTWGEVQRLTLEHPLGGIPVAGALLGFGRAGIPRAGTPHTVNVSDYVRRDDGLVARNGPSQRHVSDLSDLDRGGFVLPGGQSGFPRDPHAFDQLAVWESGGLIPVPVSRSGSEARAVASLRLTPARE